MHGRLPWNGVEMITTVRRYVTGQHLLTLVVLTLFTNLFSLALPVFSMQVFDRVLTSGSLSTLALLVVVMSSIVASQAVVDGARAVMLSRLAFNAERRAIAGTLEGFHSIAQGSEQVDVGESDAFRSGPVVSAAAAVCDAPWCIVFICALFLLHPILGWFSLLSVFVVSLVTILSHLSCATLRSHSSRQYGLGFEIVRKGKIVSPELRAMGVLAVWRDQAARQFMNASARNTSAAERQAWFDAALRAVRTALQIAILAIAATLVLSQEVQSGTIVAASMLFARALVPAERLVGAWPYLTRVLAAAARHAGVRSAAGQNGKTALPPIEGRVEIIRASLTGLDGRKSLDDVSLTIEAGQIAVIVGEQGAGKTLLLKTIAGAARITDGFIRIDGNAIADYDFAEYARQIGYVSEECDLGAGPVNSIISRMRPSDDRALVDACKLAGAHSLVQRLPQGYQSVLGPEGPPLSFGQKKRIALARAFYLQPRLLVLDEPLAGLDDDGERTILRAIADLSRRGSTIIVASRHPRLAHVANRLVMLSGGAVQLDCGGDELAQYLSPRLAATAA
jgi:ATP-binding cassette subfamily C protein